MDISFIGLRGHAKRLREIVENLPNINIKKILYHKQTQTENLDCLTNNIEDLFPSDAIFIASPTHFHLEHLISLKNYKGYIFLEKPAVSNLKDIKKLLSFPNSLKSRIYINFNFQFSSLAEILNSQLRSDTFGKVLWLDVHTSHGAAFRSTWDKSWRVLGENNLGPIETTGIHYLQYAASNFGKISNIDVRKRSVVGRSNSVDTGFISLEFSSGTWVRIRNSYATPYLIRFEMMGTNGYLTYDGSVCKIFSPRENYDKQGMFITPNIIYSKNIVFSSMWQDSLEQSICFFVDHVSRKKKFSIEKFNLNVNIMNNLL
ncbi:Gfo/Idh/MocA family oxidoreductase [Prochlorococcus sp. AH-736-A21]|nr:Gfo/Idh/MocA family oxidoreductase [Prochlorococcus sp. AH-736-A21]